MIGVYPGQFYPAGFIFPVFTYTIDLATGSYTVTGLDATLRATRVITLSPGSYAITGRSATLLKGSLLNASPGVYAVTGVAATITRVPGLNVRAIVLTSNSVVGTADTSDSLTGTFEEPTISGSTSNG